MNYARTILFCESEVDKWLPFIVKTFPESGWNVRVASTVDESIRSFASMQDIDVVILDYAFADGKGVDILRSIRDIDENVPVFLMSRGNDRAGFSAFDTREYNTLPYFIDKNVLESNSDACMQLSQVVMKEYENYMALMCTPNNYTETGNLRTVIVHAPSHEIENIDPDNLPLYLFESRPELNHMRVQHADFVKTIKENGKRPLVIDVAQLMNDIIKVTDESQRKNIVENILFSPELNRKQRLFAKHSMNFSPSITAYVEKLCQDKVETILSTLFSGINAAEFFDNIKDESIFTCYEDQLVYPVPNMYFMRDPAFVLGEFVVMSRMYWPMRRREPAIMREIFTHHPFFEHTHSRIIDEELGFGSQLYSVEGGDVMNLGGGDFAIAQSERTDRSAIQAVARAILGKKGLNRIFQPVIPAKRAFIHLDTVCSLAGKDHVVVHPMAIEAYADTLVWTEENVQSGAEPASLGKSFIKVLQQDFGKEVIKTAGGGRRSRLEQFDDATNVFNSGPDTAIVYDRNRETNKVMREAGINAAEFMGSDLVMGRGGARCMTMPLRRD